ncbi:MAG: hypothetical protein UX89_C0007G0024 [Parcubacteria group bacterium GW2011_GWA2_47_16]|nr:MAG: hypothetical protein UX89_C0007G0024 [Parcubacteria group bacterium GW2011_GWA2_47_16]
MGHVADCLLCEGSGEYYEYYVRVTTAGVFRALPAVASELYFPEIFGRTEGGVFTIKR